MHTNRIRKSPAASVRRRGGMYIMVLGTTLCVMTLGLGALHLARLSRQEAAHGQDFLEARNYARSAIEIGLNVLRNTSNWRSEFPQGTWRSAQPLGRGAYSLHVIDSVDGNFGNNQDDQLLMMGTGAVGQTLFKLSVNVAPYGEKGMDCLTSALHVATYLDTTKTITVTGPISTNNWMKIRATGVLNGNAEAVNTIEVDGTLNGTKSEGITAKEMPTSSVFDYYIANGTAISYASLSGGTMERKILTPTLNTVGGSTNAQGIYVINCGGNKITIQQCRIQGTLVLLDPKSDSVIDKEINLESASSTLPALLVRGSMTFNWTGNLSESGSGSTNFNPVNAPYGGTTDTDTTDTYPGKIKGLVYISGSLTTTASETIEGALVVGGSIVDVGGNLTITHDTSLVTSPPPGFERANRPMLPVAGTWKQVVN